MNLLDEWIRSVNAAWPVLLKRFSEVINTWADLVKKLFPVVSEAHRAEVKRVHTAYRRKQKARRRNRRR